MVQHIIKISGILLVTAALSFPAYAQLRDDTRAQARQDEAAEHEVTGTVVREKTVEVRGQDVEHQVVLLETDAGEHVVADLGPARNLEDMAFQDGRELAVTGTVGRVSDRPVLFARQISADGKTLEIERPEIARSAVEPTAMDFSRPLDVTGEIVAEKSVEVENLPDKNKVVLLELERGDSVVADLGPEGALDLALDKGEPVRVEGRFAQIGERLVLLADRVSSGDKSVEVNRLIPGQ